jgi:hypothetical protein
MQFFTAAQKYVGDIYESCVDQQLDLDAIRINLLANGLKRTPLQVIAELDSVYCFYGYAAKYPAPPKPSQAQIDASIS